MRCVVLDRLEPRLLPLCELALVWVEGADAVNPADWLPSLLLGFMSTGFMP